MRYSLSLSSILLFSLLCFLFETFFTNVLAGDIIRIPEHLHDHDEEHGEYLTIETIFKPDNCDEEHTRKSKLADHLLVRFIGYIDESSQAGRKGQMIDKSGKMPFVFRLGFDQVIRGWDEGLKDMCIGEKRRLIVPPSFGYGNQGTKSGLRGVFIEPGSTLRFEVELVGFQDKRQKQNLFMEMDTDNDGQITYKEMEWWFANKHPAKLSSIPPGTWERDDKNMDGMISWNEFSGPKGISPDAVEIIGEL